MYIFSKYPALERKQSKLSNWENEQGDEFMRKLRKKVKKLGLKRRFEVAHIFILTLIFHWKVSQNQANVFTNSFIQ